MRFGSKPVDGWYEDEIRTGWKRSEANMKMLGIVK
jgi:hypothetical protein